MLVMTMLKRLHRRFAGAGRAHGSRQETRGRSMIMLMAS